MLQEPVVLGFLDTGVSLITDEPVPGVSSISPERVPKVCWR